MKKPFLGPKSPKTPTLDAQKVPDAWRQHPRYLLFSVSGWTDTLKHRAAEEGVCLIDTNDL